MGLRVSFVPNLAACHCLLLIFDASFDILLTFLLDMLGKHIYQSVSRVVCLVGVSGLSRSLHSCQECALCCTIWVRKMCCTICVQAGNQCAFKSHFRLKSTENAQTHRQL